MLQMAAVPTVRQHLAHGGAALAQRVPLSLLQQGEEVMPDSIHCTEELLESAP